MSDNVEGVFRYSALHTTATLWPLCVLCVSGHWPLLLTNFICHNHHSHFVDVNIRAVAWHHLSSPCAVGHHWPITRMVVPPIPSSLSLPLCLFSSDQQTIWINSLVLAESGNLFEFHILFPYSSIYIYEQTQTDAMTWLHRLQHRTCMNNIRDTNGWFHHDEYRAYNVQWVRAYMSRCAVCVKYMRRQLSHVCITAIISMASEQV